MVQTIGFNLLSSNFIVIKPNPMRVNHFVFPDPQDNASVPLNIHEHCVSKINFKIGLKSKSPLLIFFQNLLNQIFVHHF